MCPMGVWLFGEVVPNNVGFNLTNTYQLVLKPDPLRFCIMISSLAGITVYFSFGENPNSVGDLTYFGDAGFDTITYDEIGSLIQQPVWVKTDTAGPSGMNFRTVSWVPWRKAVYDAIAAKTVAQFRAP